MDILVFKINESSTHIIAKLTKLRDTTIYLAVSKDDACRITREIKPKITIIGDIDKVDTGFFEKLSKRNSYTNIFRIDERTGQLDDLSLFKSGSHKKIKFEKLIEQIKKNQLTPSPSLKNKRGESSPSDMLGLFENIREEGFEK